MDLNLAETMSMSVPHLLAFSEPMVPFVPGTRLITEKWQQEDIVVWDGATVELARETDRRRKATATESGTKRTRTGEAPLPSVRRHSPHHILNTVRNPAGNAPCSPCRHPLLAIELRVSHHH